MQQLENPFVDEVTIELTRDLSDQNPQRHITDIAVVPTRAGLEIQMWLFKGCEQFVFGVFALEIDLRRIITQAGGVSQQMPDGDVFPGGRNVREVFGDLVLASESLFSWARIITAAAVNCLPIEPD